VRSLGFPLEHSAPLMRQLLQGWPSSHLMRFSRQRSQARAATFRRVLVDGAGDMPALLLRASMELVKVANMSAAYRWWPRRWWPRQVRRWQANSQSDGGGGLCGRVALHLLYNSETVQSRPPRRWPGCERRRRSWEQQGKERRMRQALWRSRCDKHRRRAFPPAAQPGDAYIKAPQLTHTPPTAAMALPAGCKTAAVSEGRRSDFVTHTGLPYWVTPACCGVLMLFCPAVCMGVTCWRLDSSS
jgi:hypothetical protein